MKTEDEAINIEARDLTQAKRKASTILNKRWEVIQYFKYAGLVFMRMNKIAPNNTISYGEWR